MTPEQIDLFIQLGYVAIAICVGGYVLSLIIESTEDGDE